MHEEGSYGKLLRVVLTTRSMLKITSWQARARISPSFGFRHEIKTLTNVAPLNPPAPMHANDISMSYSIRMHRGSPITSDLLGWRRALITRRKIGA